MVNSDIQNKLEKLQKIEDASKARSRKYLNKVKTQGKRQISAIVTDKVYDEICRRRDQSILSRNPLSTGQIIEQALFPLKNGKTEPVYNNIFDAPMNEKL